MKKFYFLLVAMFVSVVANASTVSFTNPDNWSTVYAYVWGGSVSGQKGWPGNAMTKSGDVWTITFNGTPENIIFNNGSGTQTGDLTFEDGATYNKNGVVGAELNDYKVYYTNPENWSKVCCYYWGGGAANTWPGDVMTKNADGYWEVTVSAASAPGKVIFNNGGNGSQTGDLDWTEGKVYNGSEWVEYTTGGSTEPEKTKYTVSYNNGKTAWDEVYVYMWNGDNRNADWPGVKMSLTEPGSTVWDYSVELTWEPKNVIFNNGSGSQTDDLTFTNGKEYGEAAASVVIAVWALVGADDDYIGVPVTNDEEYIEDGFSPVVDGVATFVVENWNCEGFFLMEQNLTALSGAELYTAGKELANRVAATLTEGTDVMTLPAEANGATVTFTYNVETKELTASWTTVAIAGAFNNWSTTANVTTKIVDNCAVIEIDDYTNKKEGEDDGFKVVFNGEWYGNGTAITPSAEIWAKGLSTEGDNMTIAGISEPAGITFTFALDTKDLKVVTGTTGIESIEAVAGAARYFNLQGVEVANPVNGNVYIKVVDGKASKVLVK